MKTLVIHPDDRSTDFLRPIYSNIKGAKVLTKDISENRLRKEIQSHDQILMMGHGTSSGLLNTARIGKGYLAISNRHVEILKDKRCIFIWCNADKFVEQYHLKGLYTGMFISEVGESIYCEVPADQETVDTSNSRFADLLGSVLTDDPSDYKLIFEHVKNSYGELASVNKIADYNNQRWYFEPGDRLDGSSNIYLPKIKKYMKNLFAATIILLSMSACKKNGYMYKAVHAQHVPPEHYYGLDTTYATDFFFREDKDSAAAWAWYQQTDAYKDMAPVSDSTWIEFECSYEEWKEKERN